MRQVTPDHRPTVTVEDSTAPVAHARAAIDHYLDATAGSDHVSAYAYALQLRANADELADLSVRRMA